MTRLMRLCTVLCALLLGAAPCSYAANFAVTDTTDAPDAMPGDGICATAAAVCTLRAAIQEANALAGADGISLPAGTYGLTPGGTGEDAAATGDLDVTESLTITGALSGQTIVSGAGDRVFDLFAPANVTLSRLTIQSGNTSGSNAPGGGIRNAGTLFLSIATLRANTAGGDGGGLANRLGGSAQLINVTVVSNVAGARGGGIANDTGGTLHLINVTLSGNSATAGGNVDNFGSATAVNTIVANGLTGGTCAGAVITSLGHNLDSSTTCLFSRADDLPNKDPKLGTLLDTGSTFVLPLQSGSPAIDAGDNVNCPATDQRGQLRPADANGDGKFLCDIGAYEVAGPVLPTATATPTGTATATPPPATPTNTPTATGTPATGSISIARVAGGPGTQVSVSATLSTKGASIAATENDIAFDSTNAPIAALLDGTPDCTVNLQQKEASSFAFLPDGCSGAACTGLHAAVLSALNDDPIVDGSVLYICKVDIAPSASAGEYPLTISAVMLQDPAGQPLPNPAGSSGAIVVVVPTPTQTPGAADCCQCSGPVVCGPATGGCGTCAVVFGAACDGPSGQCIPFTVTPTRSATSTTTRTPTRTPTATLTLTATQTQTGPPSSTTTATATATLPQPSVTSTTTSTPIASTTQTQTPTPPGATGTPTDTPTTTATTTATITGTPTDTPILTATPSASATISPTASATEAATFTPVPSATSTATPSETATTTATPTDTASPTASASPTPPLCVGDCQGLLEVNVTDLVTMVNVALEAAPVSACPAGDANGDGAITVDEIILAIGISLNGCPAG